MERSYFVTILPSLTRFKVRTTPFCASKTLPFGDIRLQTVVGWLGASKRRNAHRQRSDALSVVAASSHRSIVAASSRCTAGRSPAIRSPACEILAVTSSVVWRRFCNCAPGCGVDGESRPASASRSWPSRRSRDRPSAPRRCAPSTQCAVAGGSTSPCDGRACARDSCRLNRVACQTAPTSARSARRR